MPATTSWLTELTGSPKPIIGMAHLPALPGTPLYDAGGGMAKVRDWVRRDLVALQEGGIDAVMFCNENDRPYRLDADAASIAGLADVVASLRGELSVPFGVDVLWDPRATLAVAAATGAAFAREIFTGAFAGDFGLWVRSAGDAFRVPAGDRGGGGPAAVQHQRRVRGPRGAAAAAGGRAVGPLLIEPGRALRLGADHGPTGRELRAGRGGSRGRGDRGADSGQHGLPGDAGGGPTAPR